MPELPEVENSRATLQRYLRGRVLAGVRVENDRPLRGSAASFRRRVKGAKAGQAQRRGKQAFLPLRSAEGERFGLALHFGMTGRIVVTPKGAAAPRFARLSLVRAGDGLAVHFCDPRRFGRLELVDAASIGRLAEAGALGPDPTLDEWTPAVLTKALSGTQRPVKDVIMDQRRIAGVGNIYAAEALWRSRVTPTRPADSLTAAERRRLTADISAVLAESVEAFRQELAGRARRLGRGDAEAFEGPLYLSEGARNPFAVYGREGLPCTRCGHEIENTVIAARSSFFCPRCQR